MDQKKPAIFALVTSLLALAVAISWIFWKVKLLPEKVSTTKGVAVLSFENLCPDPSNAYFAEAIHEEILARLTTIHDLKVISRNSMQQYQDKPRNLHDIAKQLGVSNILEGSVRREADQVRVNVQLISAQTNSYMWTDTYNRKVTDITAVESEIAKGIAESLQIKLSTREEQALTARPTKNPEAYDAYLRGLVFDAHSAYSNEAQREAVTSYERAVELDPAFALAWARLSRAAAALYFIRADQTAARRDIAKRALQNAQELSPTLPETQIALGYYQYWVLRNYALAKDTFEQLRKILPGSSDILYALALVTRRQGEWDESIAYFEQCLAQDPRNAEVLGNSAWTYGMLRKFPDARKLYERALEITPNNLDPLRRKPGLIRQKAI
jgi:TolB-like protein/Flp pilus assembly protein TadD